MSYSVEELDNLILYFNGKGMNSSQLEALKAKIIEKKTKKTKQESGLVIPKGLENMLRNETPDSESEDEGSDDFPVNKKPQKK